MFPRKTLSQLLYNIIRLIKRLDEMLTKNAYNPNPQYLEDLTPVNNTDSDQTYSETLLWALRNPEVKNIAMTGPYGSGKSSILKTFEKTHPEYKYLKISLATFEENIENQADDRKRIEISILQQIFYTVNSEAVPFSRFRRIRNTPTWRFILNAVLLLFWIIADIFIFKPDFFDRLSWWNAFYLKYSDYLLYISLVTFLLGAIIIIIKIFKNYNSSKFQKISLTNGELELAQDNDNSILNKHLDEILYFFEKTKYDVAIIEDLDRFQDPEIFTKLRELNILINGSNQIKRKVTFVYALKDDIFRDSNRTKFFDFMIPIIPVINSSNSGEILLKKFNNANMKKGLSDTFITDITLFIDDMRMLKNIYNEYVLYKNKIGLNLNEEKLLGIIVYKNFYPTDFAALNLNKGLVYNAFSNKKRVTTESVRENNKLVNQYRDQINELEAVITRNTEELRAIYVMALVKTLPSANLFKLEHADYRISKLVDKDVFYLLRTQGNIRYTESIYSGFQRTDFDFKTVERKVDLNLTYDEREAAVNLKAKGEIDVLKNRIARLLEDNNSIQGWTLKELCRLQSETALPSDVTKEKLLAYLLKRGLIDEMYHSYISYFYEGTITRTDMDFVISVKNYNPVEFDFPLNKIDQILKRLQITEFSQKEILNYDLLDFIAANIATYEKEFDAILRQLGDQSQQSIDFIDGYLTEGEYPEIVFKSLFRIWTSIWEYVILRSNYPIEKIRSYLYTIIMYAAPGDLIKLNERKMLSTFIENTHKYLDLFPTQKIQLKQKEVLQELGIKFKSLAYEQHAAELFDLVYKGNYYELNDRMIKTIIEINSTDNDDLDERLASANYTTINKSGCVHLIKYVNNNIEYYVSEVLLKLPKNTKEDETILVKLLNEENLNEDDKLKIILKNEVVYQDLLKLDRSLWTFLFENNKIKPIWSNLILYHNDENMSVNILTRFVNTPANCEELSSTKIGNTTGEEKQSTLAMSLFILTNRTLSDDSYGKLLSSDPFIWSELAIDKLSATKVDMLLSRNKLSFSKKNYDNLKNLFDGKNITLLERNFEEYSRSEEAFDFDADDYRRLISSSFITGQQKVDIIFNMPLDLITENTLSDLASKTLISFAKKRVDYPLFQKLIRKNSSNEIDLQLLLLHYDKLNHDQIKQTLEAMGNMYKQLQVKHSRPMFKLTPLNVQSLTALKNDSLISSFKISNDKIIVYTKRK